MPCWVRSFADALLVALPCPKAPEGPLVVRISGLRGSQENQRGRPRCRRCHPGGLRGSETAQERSKTAQYHMASRRLCAAVWILMCCFSQRPRCHPRRRRGPLRGPPPAQREPEYAEHVGCKGLWREASFVELDLGPAGLLSMPNCSPVAPCWFVSSVLGPSLPFYTYPCSILATKRSPSMQR